MNHEQIQAFLTVVKTQSLSAASNELFASQSTISHRLSALEDELHTLLLVRQKGKRKIELTPAGEKFLNIAQRWDKLFDESAHLEELDNSSILHVGGVDSICSYYLQRFFRDFTGRYKSKLKLSINVFSSQIAYFQLDTHELDVGFVTIPAWNPQTITTPIIEEGYKLIVYDPENKWPCTIHPTELNQRNELFMPWDLAFQQWHNYWWPEKDTFHAYVNNSYLLQSIFLKEDKCWAIVVDCVAAVYEELPGFRVLNISDPPPERSAYMVVNSQPKNKSTKAISLFQKELKVFCNANRKKIEN